MRTQTADGFMEFDDMEAHTNNMNDDVSFEVRLRCPECGGAAFVDVLRSSVMSTEYNRTTSRPDAEATRHFKHCKCALSLNQKYALNRYAEDAVYAAIMLEHHATPGAHYYNQLDVASHNRASAWLAQLSADEWQLLRDTLENMGYFV